MLKMKIYWYVYILKSFAKPISLGQHEIYKEDSKKHYTFFISLFTTNKSIFLKQVNKMMSTETDVEEWPVFPYKQQ